MAPKVLVWHLLGQQGHFQEATQGSEQAWRGHVFQMGPAEFGVLEVYVGQWAHTHLGIRRNIKIQKRISARLWDQGELWRLDKFCLLGGTAI